MNKKLENGRYYKKKGLVFDVHNGGAVGDVELLDESGDAVRLASSALETVLPQVGGKVVVVRGPLRSHKGELLELIVEQFAASVRVDGKVVSLPYEDICKFQTE